MKKNDSHKRVEWQKPWQKGEENRKQI